MLLLYITSSILLAFSCLMTTISETIKNPTIKTIFYEIFILFMAILMLVMLYILNGLAEKIYMEEQNAETPYS
jgi:hypothetical protein